LSIKDEVELEFLGRVGHSFDILFDLGIFFKFHLLFFFLNCGPYESTKSCLEASNSKKRFKNKNICLLRFELLFLNDGPWKISMELSSIELIGQYLIGPSFYPITN